MKSLAIDVRALFTTELTGVGMYEFKLIQAMVADDPELRFILWTSGRDKKNNNHVKVLLQRSVDQHIHFSWSNKFFNMASTVGWSGSGLYQQAPADSYFFPHPNFIPLPTPKPFAVTIHDLSFIHQPSWYDLKGRLWHYALRLNTILSTAQHIIAVSESTAENIQRFFPHITSSKIQVIANGLSSESVSLEESELIRHKLDLPESFLLYVGTLEPRKNLASVIAAFLEVQKTHPELKLVVAGKFGWSKHQRELRQRHGDTVRWLDYVTESEKSVLYQQAKIFIWPSFHEGFGFPPLEAAVHGTPVITSYTTAMPELLENSAWYVNPYNYQELVDVILQVLEANPERRQRHELLDRYSWKTTAKKTLELLQTL